MPKNPVIDRELRTQLEDVIATGIYEYSHEYTKSLFPDFKTGPAQDCVVGGFVEAIVRYQKATGRPIARAVALALLDATKE